MRINFFSICFSRKLFISPSSLNNNLAGQNILDWKLFLFPFSTLKIPCCSLLAWKVSIEKSADSIMGVPLYRHTSFYCASQILFLINWRSLATLCPVSLSAPFFTQHFLTLCLCHISAILTVFQTFTCYYICHVNLWSLIFNLLS